MYKELKSIFRKIAVMLFLGMGLRAAAFAQDAEAAVETPQGFWGGLMNTDPLLLAVLGLIVLVMVLVLVTMISMVNISSYLIREIQLKNAPEGEHVETKSMWDKIYEKLVTGKLYDEKKERTTMMLDHDYDGIREMDYGMPPWLTAIFVGTIVFAIAYLIQMWGLGTLDDQITEYENEMERAEMQIAAWREKQSNLIDESSVAFVDDAASLQAGKEIFIKECKACHAEDGGGGVGPNLTDNYWIHGGSISDVFSTIKYGVPEKGMISWQTKLNPGEMQNVSSYILTLVGTEPANPKDPQGELYTPEAKGESTGEESGGEESTEMNADSVETEEVPETVTAGL